VPALIARVTGKVGGDRGYISQALFIDFFMQGVQLIIKLHKDTNSNLLPLLDNVKVFSCSLGQTPYIGIMLNEPLIDRDNL
jgi:hypothetical protein